MSSETRHLPVYFLLDRSISMGGLPAAAAETALGDLLGQMTSDLHRLPPDRIHVRVITFDHAARQRMPLTRITELQALAPPAPTRATDAWEGNARRLARELRPNILACARAASVRPGTRCDCEHPRGPAPGKAAGAHVDFGPIRVDVPQHGLSVENSAACGMEGRSEADQR